MIFGIAYATWINVAIISAFSCFWMWYHYRWMEQLHACKEKRRMRERCIELGHDPAAHGL